jgi:hypothetical protein
MLLARFDGPRAALLRRCAAEAAGLGALGEGVVEALNGVAGREAGDAALELGCLVFLHDLFLAGGFALFYTNDLHVLIEILVRAAADTASARMQLYYLRVIAVLLRWPAYGRAAHKADDVFRLVDDVLRRRRDARPVREAADAIVAALLAHTAQRPA